MAVPLRSDRLAVASPTVKAQVLARLRWYDARHDFQTPPPGYWFGWMLRSGRGAGKTRTGAEDVADYCTDHPRHRYAIVAPTFGDARDVCVEGESGVLAVLDRRGIEYTWNRSNGELRFKNGAEVDVFSAEKPDRLRGPQFHRAWCDELAAWKDAHLGDVMHTTWNNLTFGLRLGTDPRVIITTTPRQVKLVKELIERPDVIETRGSTYDNRENLAPTFMQQILRYEGTRIGAQEIYGEMLDVVEGAIWTLEQIDPHRIRALPAFDRVVVGVDPPGGITEAGIVIAGTVNPTEVESVPGVYEWRAPCCGQPVDDAKDQHYVVIADKSQRGTPNQWGLAVVEAFDLFEADRIVVEKNYGGDMVEANIRNVAPNVPVKPVNASRGKLVRAEPIHNLYEQGRVHHYGVLAELEEEQTTWVPPGRPDASAWSPNRIDALVWALTELSTRTRRDWVAY